MSQANLDRNQGAVLAATAEEGALASGEESVEDPLASPHPAVEKSVRSRFGSSVGLRQRTAQGVIINSAFQVGFACLNLLKRFVAAAFLTTQDFGIWGLVLTTFLTLSSLKEVGVSDKYIQQDEDDQELAFQKAFTLETVYTAIVSGIIAIAMPLYALAYGRTDFLLPALVLTLSLLGSAFSAPLWIPFRKMQFVRQRTLEAINPVLSTVVMIGLAVAGAGYWALVGGILAGVYSVAIVGWITCPYKLRFRFDRTALREYVGFSWPLLVASGSGLLVIQGTMLIANYSVGLSGVGAIALASSLLVFADRVDGIISRTMYPAVCAISASRDLMFEAFQTSNRLAMMWGLPFGIGLALFAPDLVTFVLGQKWEPAVPLLQALGLLVGFRQFAFNWTLFFRATGNTPPLAVSGLVAVAAFVVATGPLVLLMGLDGYIIGMTVSLLTQLATRTFYLRRLFVSFKPLRHLARTIAPSVPAVVAILGVRLIVGPTPSLAAAAAEFALYVIVTVVATAAFEREMLRQVVGYLKRSPAREPTTDTRAKTQPA